MSDFIAGHEIDIQDTGAPRGGRNYWRVLLNGQSLYEGHNGAQARLTYRAVSEGLKRATQPTAGEPVEVIATLQVHDYFPDSSVSRPDLHFLWAISPERQRELVKTIKEPIKLVALTTPPAAAPVAVGEPVAKYRERSNHDVIRREQSQPCYCWADDDHRIGEEVAAPPAAAHGDEAVRKDAERLDFILTKCRKVIVEMLPSGRDVYVEEGVMGERTYPAIHRDKDWPAGSAEDFAIKRQAIDAAMRAQGDGGSGDA